MRKSHYLVLLLIKGVIFNLHIKLKIINILISIIN